MKFARKSLPLIAVLALVVVEYQSFGAEREPVVSGVVKFEGKFPKRKPIVMTTKNGTVSDCQPLHKTPLLSERYIISKKGGVANAFVYVKKGYERKEYPVPKKPAVLNQDKCMFRPRIQGVLVGQKFLMRNSDPVLHNVRSLSSRNRPFNIGQPAKTPDREKTFTLREYPIQMQCDLHPWMKAWVFVMEHPYFSVTDEKGQFSIKGLPKGDYTLAVWHELFGEQEMKITVGDSGSTGLMFTYKKKSRSNSERQ